MVSVAPVDAKIGLFPAERRQPGRSPVGTAQRSVVLMGPDHPHRNEAEAMIRQVYASSFGANIRGFYPWLLAIRGADGGYQAVAGLRSGSEQLFSEHYLSRSVEQILGMPRENIVELGNLATKSTGHIRYIIAAATAFLQGAGFSQVVFTVVPLLYNSFRRMGLPLRMLAPAEARCLPADERQNWGSYYACNPGVYTGRIAYGYQALSELMTKNPALARVWQDAFFTGQQVAGVLRGAPQ